MAATPITGPQTTKLRSQTHATELYLAVYKPDVVFYCQVNQTFDTHDMVAQITYDNATGSYTGVGIDMLVYVGSSALAYDKGFARVRASASATVLYLNEMSEIDWANDLWVTVVNEYPIAPRHVKMDSDATVYMDYNIAYVDQNTDLNPVPNIGADVVIYDANANVSVSNTKTAAFSNADAFCIGSSISSQTWTCSQSTTAPGTASSTTLTFNAAYPNGFHVSCNVVAANGKNSITYRDIWVFDKANPPIKDFRLTECGFDYDNGGWAFSVKLLASDAARSNIRDRAKIVLFARDWFNGVEGSVGNVSGRENILAVGWIAGETIEYDPDTGNVEFRVEGPQYWLGRINGFPAGVRDTTATATKWTEFDTLTADKGIFQFLYWRTTLLKSCDWHRSGDTRRATAIEAPNGNLWSQLTEMSEKTILAKPLCDRYGRVFTEIPAQYIPAADRAADIPTVFTFTDADLERPITDARRETKEVCQVFLSGVWATPDQKKTFYSLSPGHVPGWYGAIQTIERLLLSTQDDSNELAGMVAAELNAEFPNLQRQFAGNYRIFDIAPRQRFATDVTETYSPRGYGFAGDCLPRRGSYEYDPESHLLRVTCDFAPLETAWLSTDGDPPGETRFPPINPFPVIKPIDPVTPVDPLDPTVPAYILIREEKTGIWLYSQYTSEWTNLTSGLSTAELLAIGSNGGGFAVSTTNNLMGAMRFGTGGGIYCASSYGIYSGDVTNGLRLISDLTAIRTLCSGAAIYVNQLAVNHYTGRFLAFTTVVSSTTYVLPGFNNAVNGATPINTVSYDIQQGDGSVSWGSSGQVLVMRAVPYRAYISTTSGSTWGSLITPTGQRHTRGGGYSANVFSFGGNNLVYYSTDGGATQTLKTTPLYVGALGNHSARFAMNADGSVILGGGINAGTPTLAKSVDNGANWTYATGAASPIEFTYLQNFSSTGYVGAIENWGATTGVMVSNDSGASWTDISGTLKAQMVAAGSSVAPKIRQLEVITGAIPTP